MAKFKEKIKAQEWRRKGQSIKEIAKKLGVSKGSVSVWCRDIELTPKQIRKLQERIATKGSYESCIKGARVQHERRLQEIEQLQQKGFKLIKSLSDKDILLIGAALYWGEGMKKEGRARIANSDPEIIKFMINWFQHVLGISKEQFTLQILINKIHKKRVKEVERYWSNLLGIPITQFTKTILIKAKNKKVYKNFFNYYGTITISIRRGGDSRHLINGLISAITKKSHNLFIKKPG